ncbi:MAG: hypothetical protein ABJA37_04350 [Ferruginibacter sp.]
MLSDKELSFIEYWEQNREPQRGFISKLTRGLPMAIIFGLPIILSVAVVYFFFPDWYTKISNTTSGTLVTLVIAVVLVILFFSYFRMHFKWEMNEQAYLELKYKQKHSRAAI